MGCAAPSQGSVLLAAVDAGIAKRGSALVLAAMHPCNAFGGSMPARLSPPICPKLVGKPRLPAQRRREEGYSNSVAIGSGGRVWTADEVVRTDDDGLLTSELLGELE